MDKNKFAVKLEYGENYLPGWRCRVRVNHAQYAAVDEDDNCVHYL